MRIVSQNVFNYGLEFQENFILRINLAWCDSVSALTQILETHKNKKIFLDLPVGRIKPPNNKYSFDDLLPILIKHKQIKYLAISNVETANHIIPYSSKIPNEITIVPKIESPTAVINIANIVASIPGNEKIIMLDHDDLFSNLQRSNENKEKFSDYIEKLQNLCLKNNVTLLRTIGVIFSDEEKRVSDYVG